MNEIIKPDQRILYMKIGTHAKEPLEDIIARKMKEIVDEGIAFWGYGGNTCYPKAVQPFASDVDAAGGTVYVCMQPMNSNHFADQVRADEYSTDGITWVRIPKGINVLGSRFALAITGLEQVDFALSLARTKVAFGNCVGRTGEKYIRGRVDKACLTLDEMASQPPAPDEATVKIGLVAKLAKPYAVFLRNT